MMSNSPEAWDGLHRKIRERKAKEKRYQTYSCNSFKTFRRCNECGNIYDKRDNNEGWCPVCALRKEAIDYMFNQLKDEAAELFRELRQRREESA